MYSHIFMIDGEYPPAPFRNDFGFETQRLTEGMRNTNGVDVSQPIGVELEKFSLSWRDLSLKDYEWLLRSKVKYRVNVTYYSYQRGAVVTRTFYWGNTSMKPYKYEPYGDVKRASRIQEYSANLIDSGDED